MNTWIKFKSLFQPAAAEVLAAQRSGAGVRRFEREG
jgi:hypothetical protein